MTRHRNLYKLPSRPDFTMATDNYHDARVTDKCDDAERDADSGDYRRAKDCPGCKSAERTLEGIYMVARSIEELVSEIRDDLGVVLEGRDNGGSDYLNLDDCGTDVLY